MMLLAQTMTTETAEMASRMTPSQHVWLAYAVATVLLWGYAGTIWLAGRRLKKRTGVSIDCTRTI